MSTENETSNEIPKGTRAKHKPHKKHVFLNRKPIQDQQGGARPGSGRPKGAATRISSASVLKQLSDTLGKTYAEQLAENYQEAIFSGDRQIIAAYDKMFLSKVIADKIDVTSDGKSIAAAFSFQAVELNEWNSSNTIDAIDAVDVTPITPAITANNDIIDVNEINEINNVVNVNVDNSNIQP